MTAHDPILNSERPSIASGLLVQAATRRRIEFALLDIPLDDFARIWIAASAARGLT